VIKTDTAMCFTVREVGQKHISNITLKLEWCRQWCGTTCRRWETSYLYWRVVCKFVDWAAVTQNTIWWRDLVHWNFISNLLLCYY